MEHFDNSCIGALHFFVINDFYRNFIEILPNRMRYRFVILAHFIKLSGIKIKLLITLKRKEKGEDKNISLTYTPLVN